MEDFPVPGLLEINVFVYFGEVSHAVGYSHRTKSFRGSIHNNYPQLRLFPYLILFGYNYDIHIIHFRFYTLLIGYKHACYIPRYPWIFRGNPIGDVASEVICLVVYNNGYNTNNGYDMLIVVIIYQYNNSI